MRVIDCEILIVGGGGAGMSAALSAASNGGRVTIADENPAFGGQIWRKDFESGPNPEAHTLINRLETAKISFLPSTLIFDRGADDRLFALCNDERIELTYKKLIIATGARERFLPFPGWTLPNVFGAGGLQAFVKNGMPVSGKRIVLGGTGPLLFAVADYLQKKGADVLFIAEQTSLPSLTRFAMSLAFSPAKIRQAAALRLKRNAVRCYSSSFIVSASGNGKLESVAVKRRGRVKTYECDLLGVGFHLIPNLELALLLNLEIDDEAVWVDSLQRSSQDNIYAAGEPTGIGGIELACTEGEIAGLAATGSSVPHELSAKRIRLQSFAASLNKAYELRDELKALPKRDTIVCRCEDVAYGDLKKYTSWRNAKLQTRCGMGPCQGRVCSGATEFLFGWGNREVKPPIFPVKLKHLGDKS